MKKRFSAPHRRDPTHCLNFSPFAALSCYANLTSCKSTILQTECNSSCFLLFHPACLMDGPQGMASQQVYQEQGLHSSHHVARLGGLLKGSEGEGDLCQGSSGRSSLNFAGDSHAAPCRTYQVSFWSQTYKEGHSARLKIKTNGGACDDAVQQRATAASTRPCSIVQHCC